MYRRFLQHTQKKLTMNQFWRVLSRIAKRSRKPKPVDAELNRTGIPAPLAENLVDMNPWWRGQHSKQLPPQKRSIFGIISRRLTRGTSPIIAVRGPRQVGKTTLQRQTIEALLLTQTASPDRILYVQFDQLPSLEGLTEPVLKIVRWFEDTILKDSLNQAARNGRKTYIFFDEIQDLQAWESQLKALVDRHDCAVFITGSSSLRIQQGRDSLAGRLAVLDLGPLRLTEVAAIRRLGTLAPYQESLDLTEWSDQGFWEGLAHYSTDSPLLLDGAFRAFSEWGGYPKGHADESQTWQDIATYLVDTVVRRTIDHDLRMGGDRRRDGHILREIFRLAMRYAGQAPKCSTLSRELSSGILEAKVSPREVASYLDFLGDSLLLRIIEPLQLRLKKHLQAAPGKICICDHAVRNAWLQEKIPLAQDTEQPLRDDLADQAGHVMESVIGYFLSGFEGQQLAHFPKRASEPEVDFVLTLGRMHIPIEVKYRANALRRGALAGLRSFLSKKYNAPFGIIVTRDQAAVLENIVAIPAIRFLLLG